MIVVCDGRPGSRFLPDVALLPPAGSESEEDQKSHGVLFTKDWRAETMDVRGAETWLFGCATCIKAIAGLKSRELRRDLFGLLGCGCLYMPSGISDLPEIRCPGTKDMRLGQVEHLPLLGSAASGPAREDLT